MEAADLFEALVTMYQTIRRHVQILTFTVVMTSCLRSRVRNALCNIYGVLAMLFSLDSLFLSGNVCC